MFGAPRSLGAIWVPGPLGPPWVAPPRPQRENDQAGMYGRFRFVPWPYAAGPAVKNMRFREQRLKRNVKGLQEPFEKPSKVLKAF